MRVRAALTALLVLITVIAAIELSTWALGRAMSLVVPSASVSDVDTAVPQTSEVDEPSPARAPALTW